MRARVAALPSSATSGRLLLAMPLDPRSLKAAAAKSAGAQARSAAAAAKKAEAEARAQHPKAGAVVTATVDSVHAVHAELTLEGAGNCRGRLHICEAGATLGTLQPGDKLQVG